MNVKTITGQLSTGIIVGLSAMVYAISHGALLFSGSLSSFVSIGMTASLITAVICAIGSCFFKEKTFIMGTDTSTVSVMVGSLLVAESLSMSQDMAQANLLLILFALSFVSSLLFYLFARLNLANYVRFVPFSVMAGFLASTGWLMCSGALMIISGISLSVSGVQDFLLNPLRPELLAGCIVAAALLGSKKKVSTAILIPLIIVVSTLAVHFLLNSSYCIGLEGICSPATWRFPSVSQSSWIPFWRLDFINVNFETLIQALPSILVVSFVGVMTILLAVASLELTYKKEFDLNQALRVHAASSIISGLFGGYLGIISTGRTTLNKAGGGVISNLVVALICLFMLLGGGEVLMLIPRAALGGVILFLGIAMLKNWVWDQRKFLNREELAAIAMILIVVANFGYLTGFGLGVMLACIAFVIACGKSPLTSLRTDLSLFSSSVVRHERQRKIINEFGAQSRVFRLIGYIFFGSASNIELMFQEIEKQNIENILLDFSDVIGIDRSAIGVFHRILRRDKLSKVNFYFVYGERNKDIVHSIVLHPGSGPTVKFYANWDAGLEAMEEAILEKNKYVGASVDCFDFFESLDEQKIVIESCELKSFEVGQVLCKQGDFSSEIYFLKNGSLEIVTDVNGAEVRLSKLGDGAMVGEMAFYSGDIRSATIRAKAPSQVYVLDKQSLLRLRESHPELANKLDIFVIKKLANALIRANKLIASLH
ncbi:MAG: SulP family inorganic anion transporter [Betaproteobacteria bacterium]